MLDTLSFDPLLETLCGGACSDRALLYSLLLSKRIFHIWCRVRGQCIFHTATCVLLCKFDFKCLGCSIIECIRSRLEYLNANQSDEVTKSVAILLNSMQIAHAILWRIHLSRSYYYYSLTLLTVCLWAFPVNWIRLWFTHNWYCLIPGLLGNAP